ncbi:MAG: hypothetical protein WAZ18_04460 [Alphaproteobacteria bacterium]
MKAWKRNTALVGSACAWLGTWAYAIESNSHTPSSTLTSDGLQNISRTLVELRQKATPMAQTVKAVPMQSPDAWLAAYKTPSLTPDEDEKLKVWATKPASEALKTAMAQTNLDGTPFTRTQKMAVVVDIMAKKLGAETVAELKQSLAAQSLESVSPENQDIFGYVLTLARASDSFLHPQYVAPRTLVIQAVQALPETPKAPVISVVQPDAKPSKTAKSTHVVVQGFEVPTSLLTLGKTSWGNISITRTR